MQDWLFSWSDEVYIWINVIFLNLWIVLFSSSFIRGWPVQDSLPPNQLGMCLTVWYWSVSAGCIGIQHGRAPVPEEGDWGQGRGDIFCWCYWTFWGEEEKKEEEREDGSCNALAFASQSTCMDSCSLTADHGSVLVAEHLWWCPVAGTKSVASPRGITQHANLTQNGCLWGGLSVVCCKWMYFGLFLR